MHSKSSFTESTKPPQHVAWLMDTAIPGQLLWVPIHKLLKELGFLNRLISRGPDDKWMLFPGLTSYRGHSSSRSRMASFHMKFVLGWLCLLRYSWGFLEKKGFCPRQQRPRLPEFLDYWLVLWISGLPASQLWVLIPCVWLFVAPWAGVHQAPLSMGFLKNTGLRNPRIKPSTLAF